jgi:hypothetical protein
MNALAQAMIPGTTRATLVYRDLMHGGTLDGFTIVAMALIAVLVVLGCFITWPPGRNTTTTRP